MILKATLLFALVAMALPIPVKAQEAPADYGYVQAAQPRPVKRYCQTLQLKDDPELIAEYEKWHRSDNIWKEITDGLREVGVIDSEIYRHGTLLVMILTVPADFDFQVQMGKLAQLPRQAEWEELMAKYQASDPNAASSEKWVQMKRVFKLPPQD
ncbi:L-rhamnose mutarotase [Pseudozobellia thermophila]|uniref:L-rhamnose mutarotase n=1 Tax=Pseudozobellia thermophila TaxID=192903 RepID=A0A1M6M863_9FLAO|nr:L-rhamnose mutarotase [Pseudozobellia thermophila]SHJ79560.1 L-rhamnose mutarotase [Pseudozobellia thermophila]